MTKSLLRVNDQNSVTIQCVNETRSFCGRSMKTWAQICKHFYVGWFFLIQARRCVNWAGHKPVKAGHKPVRAGRSALGNMPSWNTVLKKNNHKIKIYNCKIELAESLGVGTGRPESLLSTRGCGCLQLRCASPPCH